MPVRFLSISNPCRDCRVNPLSLPAHCLHRYITSHAPRHDKRRGRGAFRLGHDDKEAKRRDPLSRLFQRCQQGHVDKKDINLQLNDGKLTISIIRDETNEIQEKNYIHKERRYNSMSRSIYLEDSKPDAIKAKLENGVLKIIVPKEEKPNNSITIEVE